MNYGGNTFMNSKNTEKNAYESLVMSDRLYIDKTNFVKEWWETYDAVSMFLRPHRFGKTLNISMLECFLSYQYADREDLFEKFSIWKYEKYRNIQGTFPVIFLSFAEIKHKNYDDALFAIKKEIIKIYKKFDYILESDALNEFQKRRYKAVNTEMNSVILQNSLEDLSDCLNSYYGKKVIILLDDYDVPMREAYINGYWDELISLFRGFFITTFKENRYLDRAVMMGVTRTSRDSIFSDFNNMNVITATNHRYSTYFGFTEDEVSVALKDFGLWEQREKVKKWYGGFLFDENIEIYNPWSFIRYLYEEEYKTYWEDRELNDFVGKIIQNGSSLSKEKLKTLLDGKSIFNRLDEQMVYSEMIPGGDSIWSLLFLSGYLKIKRQEQDMKWGLWNYEVAIANLENRFILERMISSWFDTLGDVYDMFIKSLMEDDLESMNYYMRDLFLQKYDDFNENKEVECFYYGLMLGIVVREKENYKVRTNYESGFGRYDIVLIPKSTDLNAIVIEFKTYYSKREECLEHTVVAALRQIEEKGYDEELLNLGIEKERIKHYGFAFDGKKVLIG